VLKEDPVHMRPVEGSGHQFVTGRFWEKHGVQPRIVRNSRRVRLLWCLDAKFISTLWEKLSDGECKAKAADSLEWAAFAVDGVGLEEERR
jgi:hypothetical protein